MNQVVSLTKHYVFPRLVREIASVKLGMSENDVRAALGSPHKELSNDLFRYDPYGHAVDSVLMRVCRDEGQEVSLRVLWVALVAADYRLRTVAETLTADTGSLVESRYSTNSIEGILNDLIDNPSRKSASNLAHYYEQARIVEPSRSGKEIVGVSSVIDTSAAVPAAVEYLAQVRGWTADPVERAIKLGAHRWLAIPDRRFRAAV